MNIPDGWKLVPLDPTEEMINQGVSAFGGVYRAMIDAAPTPPAQDEPVVAMSNKTIERIALECGFKLKKQPDGSMALNPYVFEFARILLGHSNLPEPNDKLRAAAEEVLAAYEKLSDNYDDYDEPDRCVANLRAALEGK